MPAILNKPPMKFVRVLVNIALIVLLGYIIAQSANWLLQDSPQDNKAGTPPATKNTGNKDKDSGKTRADLASLHLFGKETAKRQEKATTESAPETKLKLELRGILAQDDKHKGFAIIRNMDNKEEQYFAVGHKVFKQARLKEVYDDRVILLNNGKLETLRLPEELLPKIREDDEELKAARKKVATDYRNIFLTRNGMELIKLFGFQPLHRNGGFQGFIVKALGEKGREMMETLGVEDGDLITVVNGMRLSESLEAVSKLKDLKTATLITGMIERDGLEFPFQIELDPPPEELVNPTEPEEGTPEFEAELGDDWGSSEKEKKYIEIQRGRKTGTRDAVEFDH